MIDQSELIPPASYRKQNKLQKILKEQKHGKKLQKEIQTEA